MNVRRLGFGLVLLLLSSFACQAVSSPPAAGRAVPFEDGRLAAADSRFYSGDYDAAEAAYRALAAGGTADAAAHYATLLTYEFRFQEALAEARSAVAVHPDSDALARLCRTWDWQGDVADAVAAGSRAVATRPVDPLAHVYYAEALADGGRLADAGGQLRQAEGAGGDRYLLSETERIGALIAHYEGDSASELNEFSLALNDQPGFPERSFELARYDLQNGRQTPASQLLNRMRKAHSGSYPVLVAAAAAAFAGGDTDLASTLYMAAHQLRPAGTEAALGAAEILVAVKRDPRAAHDLLLATLQHSPTSSAVYQYVRALDLLVLKTDPDAELHPIVIKPPDDLGVARSAALDGVNQYRAPIGLSPLAEEPALDQAALAHAYYFLFNAADPQLQGTGVHSESAQAIGFTGQNVGDRALHFGYHGQRTGEVIDHLVYTAANVREWINSVFHRYPLLSPAATAAGYGEARIGVFSVSVLDLGLDGPSRADPVLFPAPGQIGVPSRFDGNEVPDPLPNARYPVGYPITVEFGEAQRLRVASAHLLAADGTEVAATQVPAGQSDAGPGDWALVPNSPLSSGARYTVDVSGTVDGAAFSRRWSFTVGD